MCGNAIRCVGKYLYDHRLTQKQEIDIETLSGIKHLWLTVEGGAAVSARVHMGRAVFEAAKIPAIPLSGANEIVCEQIEAGGSAYTITCVSMGNPHAVIFMDAIKKLALEKIGPAFEYHPRFPERINTEFVHVISPDELEMRVWGARQRRNACMRYRCLRIGCRRSQNRTLPRRFAGIRTSSRRYAQNYLRHGVCGHDGRPLREILRRSI